MRKCKLIHAYLTGLQASASAGSSWYRYNFYMRHKFFLHDTSKLQQCNCATFDVDVSFCGFGAIVGRRTISTSLTLQASDSAFGFKLVFIITCTCGISFFA